ncbi:family 43 glycosylhydrolase [Caproiciproducens galactitolivorans]|uniref:Beta-xylosidase n=1 Tax=Caproiciproducens galactitolivorans TaxID=642589 RepID=A0A4Z0YDT7_9FIRM|nr:glycoside hydrolase family 43 protein [Caproiciproducens galactitolivorans]QEY35287.1 family 43 glycosylhydrolase [Caproiciproducens galactitolivorans]TGJ76983.1 beta-xylosidase [Caproiciproducens galactitolivorans]
MKKIKNPILRGFYPDPSILRVGSDYYLATSTFEWFPGVTLLHSRDLENWETIEPPLSDDSVLDLRGIDTSCGIWAPNLSYSNGIYYLLYTIVYTDRSRFKDTHNFLITASDIHGPWSKPVYLNCSGFDPSLFHDDDGKMWLVNMTIDQRAYRKRFGGVVLQEYSHEKRGLTGPVYKVFEGTQLGKTEGPNLYKHNGFYYLLCAEGGTEFGHCCTVARSKTIFGPYEVHPQNPILSSKGAENYPIQRAGHGSLVETEDHRWLMFHLCSRPLDGYSILGRETAVQNIEWTNDGWFYIPGAENKLPLTEFKVPDLPVFSVQDPPVREDFDGPKLPRAFLTLRESAQSCGISLTERKGYVRIRGGNSLCSKYRQGLLARRLQSLHCTIGTSVEFTPRSFHHMAGLVCYYNYDNYHYAKISYDETAGKSVSITSVDNRTVTETEPVPVPEDGPVYLRAAIDGAALQFSYSVDGEQYQKLGPVLNMRVLSDEHVDGNGFTGAMVGICCQDLRGDGVFSDFDWFDYQQADS